MRDKLSAIEGVVRETRAPLDGAPTPPRDLPQLILEI
jgi:hypothetical protein